ncbi:MAG: hypothetical protein QOF29_2828 [bacterium]
MFTRIDTADPRDRPDPGGDGPGRPRRAPASARLRPAALTSIPLAGALVARPDAVDPGSGPPTKEP